MSSSPSIVGAHYHHQQFVMAHQARHAIVPCTASGHLRFVIRSCDSPIDRFLDAERRLLRFKEQDGAVTQVEVDEMLRFMCDKAPKVSAHNAMPCCTLAAVELFFNVLSNVLLDVVLLHCRLGNFDCFLLHLLAHVGRLDLSLGLLLSIHRCGAWGRLDRQRGG